MGRSHFLEDHAGEIVGDGAIDPGLKEEVARVGGLRGKAPNCDGEKVAPLLVVGVFDVEGNGYERFDIRYGVGEVKGIGDIGGGVDG